MTRKLFAGIDGGGTKTSAVLVDESGAELARAHAPTSNAAVAGHERAGEVLRAVLLDAMSEVGPDVRLSGAWFGLSGSDRPEDHRRLKPYIADLSDAITMTNDAELILGALPDSVGVAVVSGTGSIAYGRNAHGDRARSGGWGHVFGDEGSGYDLARRMFDAHARATDGRGPQTSLTQRLTDELNLSEPFQLIAYVYAPSTTKGDLASLSRLVVEEAERGDDVAERILSMSAAQLGETAGAAARRLGFTHHLPLALTGGLLVNTAPFRERVLSELRREWPELTVQTVTDPALTAAQSLARAFTIRSTSP